MSLDSDSELDFDITKADSSSEEDSYADIFRPKKKASYDESNVSDELRDQYIPPPRSHVCDECEEVFNEAVFCGECNMTYCYACDERYHSSGGSEELGLKSHYRQPLYGELPKPLARQVAQLIREEEEENKAELDKSLRESAYSTENRSSRQHHQQRQREEEERQRDQSLSNMLPATAFASDYAGYAPPVAAAATPMMDPPYQSGRSSLPRQSPPPPLSPSAHLRQMSLAPTASSPSPSPNSVTWASPSELTATFPVQSNGGYITQYPPPHHASTTDHNWLGSLSSHPSSATSHRPHSSTLTRSSTGKMTRPASATPVGHVPKATMILQTTRPTSATVRASTSSLSSTSTSARPRARVQVKPTPTRMDVKTSATSLSGKSAFSRNMLLHSTPSAMVHQILPGKKRSTKGEEGAHTGGSKGKDWGDLPKHGLLLRELNEQIMALKQEISQLQYSRGQYKTSVLKKQRALKEISRIATNLAKQPNVSSSLAHGGSHHRRSSSSASNSRLSDGKPADLAAKIASLKTSNEILHLAIEEVQTKIDVLRDSDHLKHTGQRELAQLDRERSALIHQVSIDKAGRELDLFKKEQMIADLEFAIKEMTKSIDEKKKQVNEQKMNRMAAENQTRALEQEYKALQQKLDRIAEQQATHAIEARAYER